MKKIKLTKGKVVLVDNEDFEYLNQWKWCINRTKNTLYVIRCKYEKNKRPKYLYMHRIIMNTPDNMEVDHIDHNGLNNQKSNIRNCTHQQNLMNIKPYGYSKYIGVSRMRNKMRARITVSGKEIHLGHFKTEEEAALARDIASIKYYGEFASLNFPENNLNT